MTSKVQCPDVDQLTALLSGAAADADAETLRLHLSECGECSARAAQLLDHGASTDRVTSGDPPSTQQMGERDSTPAPPTAYPADGAAAPADAFPTRFLGPPAGPDEIGRLGPYRLLRLLGRGGMGVVYQAEDAELGRPVAVKILKEELADQLDSWERFLREARTLASLKHEHVVTVYHTGREGKIAYLVMELLQGCSLAEHLANVGRPPPADVLRLGRELTAGLAAVHSHGLVHRDIKPANVWVESPGGRVKILDFGLARPVRDDARLTQTGVVVGTPAYMSPEQARGAEVDQRSDLFSLGCILYRACTGVEPFRGPDTLSVLTALAVDVPTPAHELNPAVPRALSGLVTQLLAKRPEDRPATAAEVIARLEEIERSAGGPASADTCPNVALLPSSAGTTDRAEPSHGWAGLRVGLLLAGCVLAGVVGGAYMLLTPAAPDRAGKGKPAAVAEAAPEPPESEGPDPAPPRWNPPPLPVPREAPKPAEPKRTVTEYLSDWKPVAVVGWPPEAPPSAAPKPTPLPPPPPPPPPGGPKGRPPKGGPLGPPPDGRPGGPPPDGGPTPAAQMPLTLSFSLLSVNGKFLPHGIGMQAVPSGKVGLSYALDGRFDTFAAEVSINDTSARSPVALTFSVYGDGERLWQSLPVTTRSQTQKCDVSVKGVRVLQLTVTNATGEPQSVVGAHGIWIEPHVTGQK
jgi:serine/threonine protein kinase